MPTPPVDPESTIRNAIDDARPVPPRGGGESPRGGRRRRAASEERARQADNDGDDDDVVAAAEYRYPDDGPVQPLGKDGSEFYFMDANRQFAVYGYKDFGAHGLSALFGGELGQAWLDRAFPRYGKGDGGRARIIGLDKERAVRSLMAACSERGVFDADNKLRNVGAWTDIDGRLLWHLGDTVLVVEPGGKQHYAKVGPIGDHVYPLGTPQPQPARSNAKAQREAVERVYEILQQWPWKRGELDARLQLGGIGCMLIGGALRWRPAIWATGGQGTGKSTLHNDLIHPVLGGDGCAVKTSDASGAGIHQALKNRSLPVIFDELEPSPGNPRKAAAVIELARQAASGGTIIRGSADHGHREFVARAAFLFSSILIPRLEPQDAMRIAVLELDRFPATSSDPKLDARSLREIGQHLRRIVVDRWQHWPARLEAWREGLRRREFSARVADTWGTLLAMADHLVDPLPGPGEAHGDVVDDWCGKLKPALDELVRVSGSDHERLLHSLLTKAVDPYQKGQRWPLSTMISVAAKRQSIEEETPHSSTPTVILDHRKASAGLESLGLKVGWFKPPKISDDATPPPVFAMAVVKDHSELNYLLRDTKWANGAYAQTLMRMPGAWTAQQRVADGKPYCVMLPFDQVMPVDGEQVQPELAV